MTFMHSPEDDAQQFNDYMRHHLRDYRDAPTQFEQDQTRYDNQSRRRLDMRHGEGKTYGTTPYLDDAFLDQAFLSNIGNSELPDFKNLRSQTDLRIRDQVHLYNDDDNSVPSKEKGAFEHIRDRDRIYRRAQDTFKIFDTSMDYIPFGNPVGKPLLGSAQKKKMMTDQVPGFMVEEATSNRNYQVDMSNTLPVGWQTTPDSIFKVARYDSPRRMADMRTDSYINRAAGKLDTDFLVSYEGTNIPRSLALTIMDIMRQRKLLEKYMLTSGTQYGSSSEGINRQIKKLNDHMAELMRRHSDQSAATSANQLLKGETKNVAGKRYQSRADPQKIKKSVISLQLFDLIQKATNNRKLGRQDANDLRDHIIETASSLGTNFEDSNRSLANDELNNQMLWQSLAEHERNEHMTVFNYNSARPGKRAQMAGSHDMFDVAKYDALENPDLTNRKIGPTNTLYVPGAIDYEKINPVEAQMRTIRGAVNSGNMQNMIESDERNDSMRELNSGSFTRPQHVHSV